jgi:hypothetical protein
MMMKQWICGAVDDRQTSYDIKMAQEKYVSDFGAQRQWAAT